MVFVNPFSRAWSSIIQSQILASKFDGDLTIILIGFVDDDGHWNGNRGQNEAKEDGEVALVTAATTASFAASAHGADWIGLIHNSQEIEVRNNDNAKGQLPE